MASSGKTRALIALVLAGGVAAAGYILYARPADAPAEGGKPRASAIVPVIVATATQGEFQVRDHTIGTVSIDATVQVKSRVDGQVMEAVFTEGQMVRKGDLLFRIDPLQYQAQVKQAEASLARDQAQLSNAEADLKRFSDLAKKGFATTQQQEQASAQAKVLTAAIMADQAAIDLAKLQLGYTEIRSPIDGKTGRILVEAGNLVKANDVPLVVINQLQPISVTLALPQRDLPSLQRRMAKGKLAVIIAIPGDSGGRLKGKVDFINNAVDAASGTIQLKASFDNADLRLVPAQQVDAVIVLQTIDDALTIPSEAVNDGQAGRYVYVVKADKTVAAENVKVDYEDDGRSVISQGLKPGDVVVTDGQLRLAPGMKVSIKVSADAGPQASRSGISQADGQAGGQIQQAGE
jgi:membrane fusion protein, multidrug efflux system